MLVKPVPIIALVALAGTPAIAAGAKKAPQYSHVYSTAVGSTAATPTVATISVAPRLLAVGPVCRPRPLAERPTASASAWSTAGRSSQCWNSTQRSLLRTDLDTDLATRDALGDAGYFHHLTDSAAAAVDKDDHTGPQVVWLPLENCLGGCCLSETQGQYSCQQRTH